MLGRGIPLMEARLKRSSQGEELQDVHREESMQEGGMDLSWGRAKIPDKKLNTLVSPKKETVLRKPSPDQSI